MFISTPAIKDLTPPSQIFPKFGGKRVGILHPQGMIQQKPPDATPKWAHALP
jgi:hypothetical protein